MGYPYSDRDQSLILSTLCFLQAAFERVVLGQGFKVPKIALLVGHCQQSPPASATIRVNQPQASDAVLPMDPLVLIVLSVRYCGIHWCTAFSGRFKDACIIDTQFSLQAWGRWGGSEGNEEKSRVVPKATTGSEGVWVRIVLSMNSLAVISIRK
ncbi:hypothetical protein L210DRAFT_542464 [Boletus edulis BED1]|uniref:Uncharacterized protein n=1 Tax=Boletus edulis BED1 TaxID=1328754 RepID=A0AAD4BLX7_BOLED|nr:hypothetical protein L210DRAFT_542464 [Boletus edulis BED1]